MDAAPHPDRLYSGRLGVRLSLALVAASVSVAAIPASSAHRMPRITAVRAEADAHVSATARHANYGRARRLTVDSRPLTRAYVRFEVDRGDAEIRRLNLLLYSYTPSELGYQLRLATRRWKERRITFANAPRPSSRFVSSGPLRAHAWKAVDVTSLVGRVDGEVSIVLTTVGMRPITLASRESWPRGPRLVVEYEAALPDPSAPDSSEVRRP